MGLEDARGLEDGAADSAPMCHLRARKYMFSLIQPSLPTTSDITQQATKVPMMVEHIFITSHEYNLADVLKQHSPNVDRQ